MLKAPDGKHCNDHVERLESIFHFVLISVWSLTSHRSYKICCIQAWLAERYNFLEDTASIHHPFHSALIWSPYKLEFLHQAGLN